MKLKVGNKEWTPVAKNGHEIVVTSDEGERGVIDMVDGVLVVISQVSCSELEALRKAVQDESIESVGTAATT